jgi:N6-L-threonylcarbamoyladenine synthase
MYCLAIETSCDDTSVAILQYPESDDFITLVKNTQVLSSVISSQIEVHAQYGGVVPEIGARLHATNLYPVVIQALDIASSKLGISNEAILQNLNLIAVTQKPGLSSALKVGIEYAKAMQYYINTKYTNQVPIAYVNHLHGHIASAFLENETTDIPFPHLHLLVSGGNTQLLKIDSWDSIHIIAKTVDDAVGECLDKTARMLGMPYPGGVQVAKIAGLIDKNYLGLNRAMLNNTLNTSYSGLKTQVRYITQATLDIGFNYEELLSQEDINYLVTTPLEEITNPKLRFIKEAAISIQSIAMEQLVRKTTLAYQHDTYTSIGLSGGVSANQLLRKQLADISQDKLYLPHLRYTGDNAAMIGMAGILDTSLLK